MLTTQNINTNATPPFINSFREREFASVFREKPKSRQNLNNQMTPDGLIFTPEEIIASSQNLGWRNIKAFHIKHTRNNTEPKSFSGHCLILQLENTLEIEICVEGQRVKQILRPGELIIFPAGSSARCWRQEYSNQAFYLFLEPAFLDSIAASYEFAEQVTIEPAIGFVDEQLRLLAMSLLCELNNSNILGHFYAEMVANVLGLQIVRRYSHYREINQKQGGMAPFKLRKALGFIAENLDCKEDLSLEKVASSVGMSYFHFSRTFKQSMGVSPNNYIIARRVELAKKLLEQSDSTIADIALQAGFANQGHFTTMFRRLTGTTPKIFRRTL